MRQRIERVIAGETMREHDNTWVTADGRTSPRRLVVHAASRDWTTAPSSSSPASTSPSASGRRRSSARRGANRRGRRRRAAAARAQPPRRRAAAARRPLALAPARARRSWGRPGGGRAAARRRPREELAARARGAARARARDPPRGPHRPRPRRGARGARRARAGPGRDRRDRGALPGPVEAAAYYVVSEALANVAKYAQASSVTVRVARGERHARSSRSPTTASAAPTRRGSGLRGLADRVAALGGRLDVDSPPRRGNTDPC